MVAVLVLAIGLTYCIWAILHAASGPDDSTAPTRCNNPLCGREADRRVHAGDEWVPLCQGHAVELLTEGLR